MRAMTIALQCHNFQRRLCWMLSSLAQQTWSRELLVVVDHVRGNGEPSTEDVVEQFSPYVAIVSHAWPDMAEFQYRGLVRNRQLAASRRASEWIMFADSDMVYEPRYFERMLQELQREHAGADYMLSTGRTSNPKEMAQALVDSTVGERPAFVARAFELADKLPKRPMSNVGAGFSQIVRVASPTHGGWYVNPRRCKDWDWAKKGQNPKSDIQFRKRMRAGGDLRKLGQYYADGAIHLNHDRDPEVGRNLTHMR